MADQNWYIGKLKFFENSKGFGFVTESKTGKDYFIHISNIDADAISLSDNIIFKLVPSRKKVGTLEATKVYLLREFDSDPDVLPSHFHQFTDVSIRKDILVVLSSDSITNIVLLALQSQEKISTDEEYKAFREKVDSIYQILDDLSKKQIVNDIANSHLEETVSDEYRIKLWLQDTIVYEPKLTILKIYFLGQKELTQQKIFSKLCLDSKAKFVDMHIKKNDIDSSLTHLLFFLKFENKADFSIILTEVFIKKFTNTSFKFDYSSEKYDAFISSLKWLEKSISKKILDFYYAFSIDLIKLRLWLSDIVDNDDYHIYHANFVFLDNVAQQKYIKKIFFLLMKKANGLSFENISALKGLTLTYLEAKPLQLDFSCNIIIQSIESLRNGRFLAEKEIFLILSEHIQNDPSDLLSLGGFFEKCYGRSIPDKINDFGDDKKDILSLKKIAIPQRINFCEGVRFGENGRDRIYNHDCWWCRGGCCFDANQSSHLSNVYEKFTLLDFLTILNISFDKKSYFDFLGLLNKIDIFIKHLICRSCNHMLKPNLDSYYSYYRISNFVCTNAVCNNKKNVYLSHCLGARRTAIKSNCGNLIDSRDTKRCNYFRHKPTNISEELGPYICNVCGSCCSQKSLEKKKTELWQRKWSKQPGLDWKVENKVGHLENGEIFCYQCGSEMVDNEKEYKLFIEQIEKTYVRDLSFKVLKKGINAYGFWYMVQASEDFFNEAQRVGLRVSQTKGDDNSIKFIASGKRNLLTCQKCNMKYDKSKVEFADQTQSMFN